MMNAMSVAEVTAILQFLNSTLTIIHQCHTPWQIEKE